MQKQPISELLAAIVGPKRVTVAETECALYAYDASYTQGFPDLVVHPANAEQVAAIMHLANQHQIPVYPRGAGTGQTGGSVPVSGGIVISLTDLNKIIAIDPVNMVCTVEPGVITADLKQAAAKLGLYYPPDPGSSNYCTIGGNVAECAGGLSGVKYGVTRDYVLGLEAVLANGELLKTGGTVHKNVTGYDLTRLLVGSEGTLAVVTKIHLRLLPKPESVVTLLFTFAELGTALEFSTLVLTSGIIPVALEFLDKTAISCVSSKLPSAAQSGSPEAMILIELDGPELLLSSQAETIMQIAAERAIFCSSATAQQEREALWQARRALSMSVFKLAPSKLNEDVCVPRSKLEELISFMHRKSTQSGLPIVCFGHAGDGNVHINIMTDRADQDKYQRGKKIIEQLFAFTIEIGGTLSGEHGIGATKARFLNLELSPTSLLIHKKLKEVFDPRNILNPGKFI